MLCTQFNYDSFGNMQASAAYSTATPSNTGTPSARLFGNPSFTASSGWPYDSNNRLVDATFDCAGPSGAGHYDAAGNMLCDGSATDLNARQYTWDAESRLAQVGAQHGGNTYDLTAMYSYDGNGSRIRSDQFQPGSASPSSWREYSFFAGQLLAEKDQSGNRTNYIYANGKKIARLGADQRLHREATVCGNCGWQWTALTTPVSIHGHVVQPGDRLAVSQYQTSGTAAGVGINFTDGTYAAGLPLADQDGGPATSDSVSGQWHHRVIDLSSQTGKTVDFTYFITDGNTAAGAWSVDYRDFTFLGADGSVTKLYSGENPSGLQLAATAGQANLASTAATGAPYPGNTPPQSYYLADHLGTTQMELSTGGWPTWRGDFAPFGQELDNQPTSMRFKFTGKERDAESGLDYFGARYYASTMGRFSSPDPSALYFANPNNPQSLNLYTYALNNPMINVDPDGLRCVWDDGSFDSENDSDTAAVDSRGGHSNCTDQGGTWYDKGQYSPGVDWASTNTNGTLTLHVNAGPFQPGYTTNQGGQPSAAAAAADLTSSTAVGLISDIFTGRLNIYAPTAQDPHDDSHRLFDTVNCGPGGNGSMDGLMNSRCAIHDACFDSAHLSAANNAAGGPGMTQSQKDAATACNQALYNAARANPTRAGASALQWWLVKGANPPFGGSLIAPGTEAKPW